MKKFLSVKWVLVAVVATTLYFNIGHIFAGTWNTVCQNGGRTETTFQTIVTVNGEMAPFCKPHSRVMSGGGGGWDDQSWRNLLACDVVAINLCGSASPVLGSGADFLRRFC